MDTSTVFVNLALVAPMAVLGWLLALKRPGHRLVPAIFWWGVLILSVVPLGGFLAALVGLAFNEPLRLAPFSWVDSPLFAIRVIAASAIVGGFFSFGMACALARWLASRGISNLPTALVNSTST